MKHIVQRLIEKQVLDQLSIFPAVYINGPRQAGKTTLVRDLLSTDFKGRFVTFDDLRQRSSAMLNPQTYIETAGYPLIIDEIQMVPDICYALKKEIDDQRFDNLQQGKDKPNGRYLLTGSADLGLLPQLADSMVGRMGVATLLPFSTVEYWQTRGDFIDRLFAKDFIDIQLDTHNLVEAIQIATYPELIDMKPSHRQDWFELYIRKITLEDPREIYNLEKAEYMPPLLQILASRAGSMINDADIGREIGLTAKTSRIYRNLFDGTFITISLRPWYRNIDKRLVKSGKLYFYDTVLLSYLLQATPDILSEVYPHRFGHLLENFVLTELLKLKNNTNSHVRISFYRTQEGREVDFVLENPAGQLVGIEVKNAERITEKDISGLKELQTIAGKDFICGIVLCNTPSVLSYGDNIYLVPISALWS